MEGGGSGLGGPLLYFEDGDRIYPSLARRLCFMKWFFGCPSP